MDPSTLLPFSFIPLLVLYHFILLPPPYSFGMPVRIWESRDGSRACQWWPSSWCHRVTKDHDLPQSQWLQKKEWHRRHSCLTHPRSDTSEMWAEGFLCQIRKLKSCYPGKNFRFSVPCHSSNVVKIACRLFVFLENKMNNMLRCI